MSQVYPAVQSSRQSTCPVNGHYIFILPSSAKLTVPGGSCSFDPESDDQNVRFITIKLGLDSDFVSIFHHMSAKCGRVSRIKPIEAITRFLMVKGDLLEKRYGHKLFEDDVDAESSDTEAEEETDEEAKGDAACAEIECDTKLAKLTATNGVECVVSDPKEWSSGSSFQIEQNLIYFGFIECYYKNIIMSESQISINLLEVDGNVSEINFKLNSSWIDNIRIAQNDPFWAVTPNELFAEEVICKFRNLAGEDSVGFGSFFSNTDNKMVLIQIERCNRLSN